MRKNDLTKQKNRTHYITGWWSQSCGNGALRRTAQSKMYATGHCCLHPLLPEQKRMVAKIESLPALCDRIEADAVAARRFGGVFARDCAEWEVGEHGET